MSSPAMFFESTKSVTDRLGELCNFVWASTVGLWTLREQVNQFVAETGQDGHLELHDRFVKTSGVTSADLRTTCIKWTWDQQKEQLARILLFNLCGLFESWLEFEVPLSIGSNLPERSLKKIITALQMPTPKLNGDYLWALGQLKPFESTLMKSDYYPMLRLNKKNSWSNINFLLIAYRYFKECRNSLIHAGGIARPKEVDAYANARSVDYKDLLLSGPMTMPPVTLNDPIQLELADVVALSSIVHRLIVTYDAELSTTSECENIYISSILRKMVTHKTMPKKDPVRWQKALRSIIRQSGYLAPANTENIEARLGLSRPKP